MKVGTRTLTWLLAGALLFGPELLNVDAKSYSSGGGKSYSSSSSRSSSSRSSSNRSSSSRSSSSRSSSSSKNSSGGSKSSGSSSKGSSSSSRSSSGSSKSSGNSGSSSSSRSSSGSSSNGGSQGSRESGSSSDSRKTFTSSERKSYSSRPTGGDSDRQGYSSGKSYSSGTDRIFSSTRKTPPAAPAKQEPTLKSDPSPKTDEFSFDTTAAKARKEEASKVDYTRFKERSSPPPAVTGNDAAQSGTHRVQPPPIVSTQTDRRTVYVPTVEVISTRPARVERIFRPYYSRPVVVYQDRYDTLFWWWLLDRSLDDRARWTYHHRYDMDPARYDALVSADQQLAARVTELEAQEVARDAEFVPAGVDRDLMYTDQYVATAYSNRPTRTGTMMFWFIAVPAAIGVCWFFIWLIWFKRWQTSN